MTQESEAPLVPVEEKTVEFYDDEILAVAVLEGEERQIYVPMRPVTEHLGLTWSSQYMRIQRDDVLSEKARSVLITRTEAGEREFICLPIEYLHGWLFGIQVGRVKEEYREKLRRYKDDCYHFLWSVFQEQALTQQEATPAPQTLQYIRSQALAIAALAEEQMAIERRVTTTEDRLDKAAMIVGELGRRVGQLELRATPASLVTDEQAAEIASQVKALAQLLTEQDPSKNHFGSVYGELYRRFGVSSYKNIRQDRYSEVLDFLEDWRALVASEE